MIIRNRQSYSDGASNYVVLMTFGYRTDTICHTNTAMKKLAYREMLGSRKQKSTPYSKKWKQRCIEPKFVTPVRVLGWSPH